MRASLLTPGLAERVNQLYELITPVSDGTPSFTLVMSTLLICLTPRTVGTVWIDS